MLGLSRQRYDVIVNASQTADNYWFCIGVGMDCGYNAILSSNIQAWRASQGLIMEFLERKTEIKSAIGDVSIYNNGCVSWNSWWNGPHAYEQTDFGL